MTNDDEREAAALHLQRYYDICVGGVWALMKLKSGNFGLMRDIRSEFIDRINLLVEKVSQGVYHATAEVGLPQLRDILETSRRLDWQEPISIAILVRKYHEIIREPVPEELTEFLAFAESGQPYVPIPRKRH